MSNNTPSFRLPFTLPEDVHPAVRAAIRYVYNGLVNHEQAFAQIGKTASAASTSTDNTTVGTSASLGGDPPWTFGGTRADLEFVAGRTGTSLFGGLGTVNTGASAATDSSYSIGAYPSGINVQPSNAYQLSLDDYFGVVVFNTPLAVGVSLNSIVPRNFNCWIFNQDSGRLTLTPTALGDQTPTVNGAASVTLAANSITQVFFDGANWYAVASNIAIIEINGTIVGDPNFNNTSPAAQAGYVNVKWQTSAADVSAEVPIATSSVLGLVKPDNSTIGVAAGVISTAGYSGSVALAKLTAGGANGSLTVVNGLITAVVQPT